MDTERVTPDSHHDRLLAFIGGTIMILYGLVWLIIAFLTDTFPYTLRTIVAVAGLFDPDAEEQAELLERLNDTRSKALSSNEPYGLYDEANFDWDAFAAAGAACWQAGLAPWRINLAGGSHAMLMQPYTSTTPPSS